MSVTTTAKTRPSLDRSMHAMTNDVPLHEIEYWPIYDNVLFGAIYRGQFHAPVLLDSIA